MRQARIIFIVYLFFCSFKAISAEPVVLDDKVDYLVGKNYIEIFEDKSGKLSLEEIQGNAGFRNVRDNFTATQNATSHYWIRFKLNRAEHSKQKWVLEILDSRQDEILLYEPSNGTYTLVESGMNKGFSNRSYKHKNILFDLNPEYSNDQYYYLRVKSKVITSMLFKIRTLKDLSQYAFSEYYLLGLYYGILAMMIIFSIFLYFSIR